VGRLLITFILCVENVLSEPLLYLSLYLKEHRQEYYDALQAIRAEGDWEGWLRFFLHGVSDSARQATETAAKLVRLFEKDRAKIHQLRGANTALRVHEILKKRAMLSIPEASRRLKVTRQTVDTAVGRLEEIGLVKEMTGRSRDRVFGYSRYLQILNEGIREES
jgi:Fic family protein